VQSAGQNQDFPRVSYAADGDSAIQLTPDVSMSFALGFGVQQDAMTQLRIVLLVLMLAALGAVYGASAASSRRQSVIIAHQAGRVGYCPAGADSPDGAWLAALPFYHLAIRRFGSGC
jgi:hypothetical protein